MPADRAQSEDFDVSSGARIVLYLDGVAEVLVDLNPARMSLTALPSGWYSGRIALQVPPTDAHTVEQLCVGLGKGLGLLQTADGLRMQSPTHRLHFKVSELHEFESFRQALPASHSASELVPREWTEAAAAGHILLALGEVPCMSHLPSPACFRALRLSHSCSA